MSDSEFLFAVNGEGGPLLCMDAQAASEWRGAQDGSSDYSELCARFDADPDADVVAVRLAGLRCIAWEMRGAGTADVFIGDDGVIRVVRAWLADARTELLGELAKMRPIVAKPTGEIDVPSGALVILWSPESGLAARIERAERFRVVPETSIAESAFVLRVSSGTYTCLDERVAIGESEARRLALARRSLA